MIALLDMLNLYLFWLKTLLLAYFTNKENQSKQNLALDQDFFTQLWTDSDIKSASLVTFICVLSLFILKTWLA